jgi:UDP-2,4-diacetamido-2,4,6-trideoxy-beta-L-altropyranose hydrolase
MRVAIRTDASVLIGSGHVMRCLALAECLLAGGAEVMFICREHDGHLCRMLASRGFAVTRLRRPPDPPADSKTAGYAHWLGVTQAEDARESLLALERSGPWDWLVVDHYALDSHWEQVLRSRCGRLLVIDDLADRPHACDILLDQSAPAVGVSRYKALVPEPCLLLEGPRYALLRTEFSQACLARRHDKLKRLLIFFGGSDLDNETGKAVLGVRNAALPGLIVDVVIGASNPHKQALQTLCATLPGARVHSRGADMARLMLRADLAIGAGGVTLWERCSLGLPSIVLSCADNQNPACEHAAAAGAILYMGHATQVTSERLGQAVAVLDAAPSLRAHLSTLSRGLVDARGTQRLVRLLSTPLNIDLRPATLADRDAILQWRNDESTRRYSTNPLPIDPATHGRWYARVLDDPDCAMFIGQQGDEAVGVLRYERTGTVANVSIFLVPGRAGRGLGRRLLMLGREWVRTHWPEVRLLQAQIKLDNQASLQTFLGAGFVQDTGIFHLQLGR